MNKKMDKDLNDVVKAMRKGNREAEQEILGPGFHSQNRVHKSAKNLHPQGKAQESGFQFRLFVFFA